MDERNVPVGLAAIAFGILGLGYLAQAFLRSLDEGHVRGRMGAIHLPGSIEYLAFFAFYLVGTAVLAGLVFLGLRWIGVIGRHRG